MANTIFTRRSIRRFLDKPVESEKLDRILKAGMQAPSAHNGQPWEFLVITEQPIKDEVSKMSPWAGMVAKAPVTIIVLGNIDTPNARWIQQDLSACTQNILLQIAEEGLGGCWMGFYPEEERVKKCSEYFNLPKNIIPFSLIALGYSDDENRYIDRSNISKIHFNKY